MQFPKRNKSNRFLLDIAKYSYNSGVVIGWGSNCDDWVSIDIEGYDGVFMQGSDATEFMQEMENLQKRYRSFDAYTAALVIAKPYVESCF